MVPGAFPYVVEGPATIESKTRGLSVRAVPKRK